MNERGPTCIGRVKHVLGSTVTVALSPELAGIAPIFRGQLQPIGQIGSLVRIPQGLVDLVATVGLLGISELSGSLKPGDGVQHDERWLQVHLLGEVDRGTGSFRRGVSSYPGLDDPVHFATPEQLRSLFPLPGDSHVRLGRLSAAEEVPVCLDAARLVVRHSAVVGSTGSGKTSAVASLVQSFLRGGWTGAKILVIDPHGEYSSALAEYASVRSVLGDGDRGLRVPYWALPANEIARGFTGSAGGGLFSGRFSELVTAERRASAAGAAWLDIDPATITPDTPIPFDIRRVWHSLDYENNETRTVKADSNTVCLLTPGDAAGLIPATFRPYNPGNQAPFQAPTYRTYGNMPALLRLGLMDRRLRFFQGFADAGAETDPLVGIVQEWLGDPRPVSVLDFSGVPAIAADLAIGLVLNLLFEICVRSEANGPGIGRPHPVLAILEEAHRHFGEDATSITRDAVNRIAREGRKYGFGLMMVTQRPTELPKTALAQCGTLIALRLSNSEDQNAVKAALPDSVSGLAAALPSMRTGEALISGEATTLPVRVLLDRPSPRPRAEDPTLDSWRLPPAATDIRRPLELWRGLHANRAE